jgi:hypothetical protein
MIDGGSKRASQPTGKNAADFVDWTFARDYGLSQIRLDVMMASHNDADHDGGLSDLLNVDQIDELDATTSASTPSVTRASLLSRSVRPTPPSRRRRRRCGRPR